MTSGKMQEGLEKQEQYKKEQEVIHDMIVFANLLKYAEIVVGAAKKSWKFSPGSMSCGSFFPNSKFQIIIWLLDSFSFCSILHTMLTSVGYLGVGVAGVANLSQLARRCEGPSLSVQALPSLIGDRAGSRS